MKGGLRVAKKRQHFSDRDPAAFHKSFQNPFTSHATRVRISHPVSINKLPALVFLVIHATRPNSLLAARPAHTATPVATTPATSARPAAPGGVDR